MPLAGYDLVLGTQWLATLSPVLWDLGARQMSFQRHGHDVRWTGVATPSELGLHSAAANKSLLEELLDSFGDVFAEPQGLPSPRGRDHSIVLKPGSSPVAVRPYRYPASHKDELERQCAAMLEQGIIRCSISAFSSPVILVMKPDGS
jgi:hypothetical protein